MPDRIKALSARFMAERHALMGFIYSMIRDLAGAGFQAHSLGRLLERG